MREVWVTGLGLASGLGLGVEPLLAALGQGGAAPAELPFPCAGFPHQRGFCGPDRRVLAAALARRKDLKLCSRDALLAVSAAVQAWTDAGLLDLTEAEAEEVALFLAVGPEKGEVEDMAPAALASALGERFDLERFASAGMPLVHPLDSLKTLPNMALAHVSMRLGLRGPNLALCGEPEVGLLALEEGWAAVAEGRCSLALAGGADSLVTFAGYVPAWRGGALGPADLPGEAGALLLFEDAERARDRGQTPYGLAPAAPTPELLARCCGICGVASGPLLRLASHASAGRQPRGGRE